MSLSVYGAVVALLGFMVSRVGIIKMQVLLLVLGGTSAIILTAIGGATIVIPVLCLPFFIASALQESRMQGRLSLVSPSTLWLGATAIWGALLAFVSPRMLPKDIMIMALSREEGVIGTHLVALAPTSGNLTQSFYALSSVAAFAAARTLIRRPERVAIFCEAVLTLTLINCAAGLLNLAESLLHLPSLLDELRTAYAVTHQEIMGRPRIQGTFPETSAFSGFSLPLFGFSFQCWLDQVRPRRSGLAAAGTFILLVLSTSGTAYMGMSIYCIFVVGSLYRRALQGQAVPKLAKLAAAAMLVVAIGGGLIAFDAPLVKGVSDIFDFVVTGKLGSDSGKERTAWNEQGIQNFFDSYGLGLGFGTIRSSSFAVALISNTGIVGTLTFCLFLWHVLRSKTSRFIKEPIATVASRHAVIAALCAAAVSATVFDLGIGFYLFAAVASLPVSTPEPSEPETEDDVEDLQAADALA